MKRFTTTLAATLALVVVVAGCQTMTGKTAGQNVDDGKITAEVKAKLVKDQVRNLTAVNVDTNKGVVYLTGNVSDAEHRAAAERIARDTKGVRDVVNNLQVMRAAAPASPATTAAPATTAQSAPKDVTHEAPAQVVGGAPAASPATDMTGRHTVSGEVTSLDHNTGKLTVRTADGDVNLRFPPSALANIQQGQRVDLDLGLHPAR